MCRLRITEELAWQNGSRLYAIIYHMSSSTSQSTQADCNLVSAFLTATSQLAFVRIDETCRVLAADCEDIAATPKFAIRCAGRQFCSCLHALAVFM